MTVKPICPYCQVPCASIARHLRRNCQKQPNATRMPLNDYRAKRLAIDIAKIQDKRPGGAVLLT